VEPSAANLALQSEDFMTTWGISNTTRTANQATSPDNTLTADRISITSNGGYIRQLLATSNSLTYTLSCFVKNDAVASGDTFRLYFNNNVGGGNAAVANATININAGTVSAGSSGAGVSSVSASIENYGNGWYRVRLTFTLGASAGNASSEIGFEAPTATRTFFAWGAQLEVGSVPTSYIPTTTQAITRAAEVINKTGVSSLIGQTEGTIYAEVDIRNIVGTKAIIALTDGTIDNRIVMRFTSSTVLATIIRVAGATNDYSVTIPTIPSTGGIYKIAFAYKANDYCLALNGTAYASTATRAVPATNSMAICQNGFGADFLNDRIRAAAIYPTRLTNAQLQALTT
jgi:hypothetical protein